MKTVINLKSDVYYQGIYWNDYPEVRAYMCKNFTGDANKWWVEDFKERYAKKPFNHALFLNCGDGRWERDFIDKGIVKKVTAFDISPDLIAIAKKNRGRRKIKYLIADANKINFPKNQFDLVVNYAALHHTQYINRICKILADSIKSNGYLVNFEYIGPHRNQYPILQWLLAKYVNAQLPEFCQQDMKYPHLPTMLVSDPTEAIHSELIMKCVRRYFTVVEKRDTGGGIAYLLLTHNQKMKNTSKSIQRKYINKILEYDHKLTYHKLVPNLFSYFILKPKKIALDKKTIRKFKKEEFLRESLSAKRRGVYSFFDYLKLIINSKSTFERLYLLIRYPYLINSVYIFRKITGFY